MSFLLDANVLIALAWPTHEHHERSLRWFRRQADRGWATTPFTQAAFVRVVSQPTFSGHPVSIDDAAELLARNTAHAAHRFLPMNFGFDEVARCCTGRLLGHRQITDAYLLTLAIRHDIALVTFDTGIAQLLADPAERARHLVQP